MNTDDYALHFAQKYRLAICIAILNTKPDNLTIDEHIDQIKNIINEKNIDDMDISAWSDDFNIDSSEDFNDQNILSQDDDNHCNRIKCYTNEINEAVNDILVNDNGAQVNDNETQINDNKTQFNDRIPPGNSDETQFNAVVTQGDIETQLISYKVINGDETQVSNRTCYIEESQNYIETRVNDNDYDRDLNTSITILHNFEEATVKSDEAEKRRQKMREVIKVLKGVDGTAMDEIVETQKELCNRHTKPSDPKGLDQNECYAENYNILNNTERDDISRQNNSNSTQRVQDTVLLRPVDKYIKTSAYNLEDTRELRKEIKKRMNEKVKNVSNAKIAKKIDKTENYKLTEIDSNTITNDFNFANNNSLQDVRDKDQNRKATNIATDSQTTLYIATDNTQFNTHYSQSQTNDIVLDNRFIHGSTNTKTKTEGVNEDIKLIMFSNSQNSNKHTQHYTTVKNSIQNDTAFLLDVNSMDAFSNNETQGSKNIIQNVTATEIQDYKAQSVIENDIFSQNAQNMDLNDNTMKNAKNTIKGCAVFDKTTDIESILTDGQENMLLDKNSDNGCVVSDKITNVDKDNDLDTLTDGQEKIPFKIIEETNRIKMYLRRKEMQDSSGYTTSKCSFGSSQTQKVWIGQSAYSIFNYLSSCSLVTATQDLTEQISEVLGQLIDTLHEEECYPTFLEDLLKTIDQTLKLVYEEENYVFDMLLKKDEQIQRILLFNKSTHIQKYTIDQINKILQKLLDEISADTYEIQNIDNIENLNYIFQILQTLLTKYSTNYSQFKTQNSQEKCLRKRDISDIWRKKWFNIKKSSNEGSIENKCVLRECSAILNKIIVSFMDGYSLIAFSALNCFNMMQTQS